MRAFPSKAALVAGAAFAVGACGGDSGADPESTQARVNTSVPRVIDNAAASFAMLSQSETLASVGQSLGAMGQMFGLAGEDGAGGNFRLFRDGDGFGDDLDGEELARFLTEQIFTDENYEGDGYYRLPADLLCPPGFDDTPDPACVEEIDAAELRLRAVLAGEDGLDLSLAIGPSRIDPMTLELRPDSLAVAADLGELRAAAVFLAGLAGEALDDVPDVLEGVIAVSFVVHGDEHASMEFAVREAVFVEGDGVSLSLGARDPMLALEVDVPEETVTATFDMGPLNVQGPWDDFDPSAGAFELDLQGLSAQVTLQEGARSLQIENISLGGDTSSLSLDGERILSLDLNPDSGRALTLTLLPEGDDELPTFGFDPELDLSVGFFLQPLADRGEDVPEFLLDDTLGLAITGSQPTIQPVEATAEHSGGIRVVSGELSLASESAGEAVVVAEGLCLVEREPEQGDHPLIGSFAEASCDE